MSEEESAAALTAVLDLLPPLLADFLATDVRRDVERCDALLAGIARARSGEAFEAFGNIYQLSVEPEAAILRSNEDPECGEIHLSLDALTNVLLAWREAIDQASAGSATAIAKSCKASDQPD
jgi:hypothetical protein